MIKIVGCLMLTVAFVTCTTQHKSMLQRDPTKPPCIVYKTRNNYDSLVHIVLTEDKKHVASYPAPVDVTYNGKLAYPTKLADGFLLDNRGISTNSVFLNITLQEYSRLEQAPTEKEMLAHIIDANPFVSIYYCGNKSLDSSMIPMLNSVIRENRFDEWQKVK